MIRILSHSLKCELSCDGYEFHSEREAFKRTGISRGNYSCRAGASYASRGGNPERDGRGSSHDRASDTAESAGTEDQEKQPRMRELRQTLPIGGAFAAGLVAAVVLMILVESFFPTLFYHLTSGL